MCNMKIPKYVYRLRFLQFLVSDANGKHFIVDFGLVCSLSVLTTLMSASLTEIHMTHQISGLGLNRNVCH